MRFNSHRWSILGTALAAAWSTLVATGAEGYAVRVTATVQSSPPQITLHWPAAAADSYTVARKTAGGTTWGAATTLPGGTTSFTDAQVSVGTRYEYQVVRRSGSATAYGYIASGIEAPLLDTRGRVILVVDNSHAGTLSDELLTLMRDLTGDGWTVSRIDVSPSDSPASVRDRIRTEYNADRTNTRAVFLLGRIPVVRSGNLNVDGHGGRPLPADVFYGDMDGTWADGNGDGVYDHNSLPSDVELQVGRVDFADMPVGGASEAVLLQQYLFKNHDFRHAVRRPPQRALIGDRFGPRNGEAYAASAYRAFPSLVGNGNLVIADASDNASAAQRWISQLTGSDYLWVYGGGAGADTAIGYLGTHGQYLDVWSADLIQQRARGTFYLLFGSWFVDWSRRDNIMRAALAVPDSGLAAAWSGRPHWFVHPMAMGETIGYATRLTQNNTTHYTNQINQHTRGIHIALMGDPTLKQQIVAPPGALNASGDTGGVALSWGGSRDSVSGYHVYRASNPGGPYTRLTTSPVNSTSFRDTTAPAGQHYYMVRAIKLETTAAGSFYNASQGVFAEGTSSGGSSTPPPSTPSPNPPPSTPSPGPTPPSDAGGGGGAASWWFAAAMTFLALSRSIRPSRLG